MPYMIHLMFNAGRSLLVGKSLSTGNQKLKLFISYGREEVTNSFAVKLYKDLKSKNYEPTLDVIDFLAGESLSYTIADKIANCDVMIIILSKKYSQSKWCRKELNFADKKDKKMLLIKREEECNVSNQVEFIIEDWLYLRFITDEEYEKNFKKLIEALEKVSNHTNKLIDNY